MERIYISGDEDRVREMLLLKHRIDASQAICTAVQFVSVDSVAVVEGGWHPAPLNELYPDAPHIGDVLQIRSVRYDTNGDYTGEPRTMSWRVVSRRYQGATHESHCVQGMIVCLVEPADGPWGMAGSPGAPGAALTAKENRNENVHR